MMPKKYVPIANLSPEQAERARAAWRALKARQYAGNPASFVQASRNHRAAYGDRINAAMRERYATDPEYAERMRQRTRQRRSRLASEPSRHRSGEAQPMISATVSKR